jgi:hypothetical protein
MKISKNTAFSFLFLLIIFIIGSITAQAQGPGWHAAYAPGTILEEEEEVEVDTFIPSYREYTPSGITFVPVGGYERQFDKANEYTWSDLTEQIEVHQGGRVESLRDHITDLILVLSRGRMKRHHLVNDEMYTLFQLLYQLEQGLELEISDEEAKKYVIETVGEYAIVVIPIFSTGRVQE